MFWHLQQEPAKGSAPWARSFVWRGSVAVLMTGILACRDLLVPALALGGTAMALAGADTAQDVVLNSLAAGFIFDLDGNFYRWVIAKKRQDEYQSDTIVLSALVTNDDGVSRQWNSSTNIMGSCLYVVNLALCFLFYVMQVSPGTDSWPRPAANFYFFVQMYMHGRVLCFLAFQIYVRRRSHIFLNGRASSSETKREPTEMTFLKYLLAIVSCLGQSYFTQHVMFYGFADFGSLTTFYVGAGSPMEACLMGTADGADCAFPVPMFAPNHTVSSDYTYETWYGGGAQRL